MGWNEKRFWEIYDVYINDPIENANEKVINELSAIIRENEDALLRKLKRPEKGWIHIYAWECISTARYYTENMTIPYIFFKGEIIVIDYPYDRDMHFTRIPYKENVSWEIYDHGEDMKGNFIPLFDKELIIKRVENILKIKSSENLKELKKFFKCARSL
ncbi:MAG: hypothetical protein PHU61_03670 [Candidatus Absconditabacteria bacterium]|nr:hypothetical protein [Candidatus Absconditabacteria bacterium]MDD3868367.1 hypothetical protein [Candidatus Absconditabacteria bacterium]MDD4714448.1 hypothetical protein [Candidatus Absconditabacteria bacterium]